MKELSLAFGARPCIKCGYCCRTAPCSFGKWDHKTNQCLYLTEKNFCGVYEKIISRPVAEWELEPSFGSGCCSPFNSDRRNLIGTNS